MAEIHEEILQAYDNNKRLIEESNIVPSLYENAIEEKTLQLSEAVFTMHVFAQFLCLFTKVTR